MSFASSRKRSSLFAPLLARPSLDAHSCLLPLRASAHRYSLRSSLVPRSMLTHVFWLFAQALIAIRSAPRSSLARCSLMSFGSSRKRSSLFAPLLARPWLDAHSCLLALRASAHRYSLRSSLVPGSMLTHVFWLFAQALIAIRSAPRSSLARCSLMSFGFSRKRSSLFAPLLARPSLDAHSWMVPFCRGRRQHTVVPAC